MSNIEIFFSRMENPRIAWPESYKLIGMCQGAYTLENAHGEELNKYSSYWYSAKCLLCQDETKVLENKKEVVDLHFMHCSRKHGYIFDENALFQVKDSQLQNIIRLADLHNLPLPGFEDHSGCVKQFIGDSIVCAIHVGNEYSGKHWSGSV